MKLEDVIEKYALENAAKYQGRARPGAVIGSVIREMPGAKKDMKVLSKQVAKQIGEINQLPVEEQEKLIKEKYPELLEEKPKEEKLLKELPGAEPGKAVFRIAPSPSGALHIGHAYGASLNYEYAAKYNGRFIVRIEDTNPANIYPDAYNLIKDDASWLCDDNISEFIVQSDRLKTYHELAEKLVKLGKAYVCECNPDSFRKLKADAKPCPCRKPSKEEHLKRFRKMFKEYAEGGAVLRFKSDIKHKNPAMRDFPIMRINDHVHPRTGDKNRVWPLMVFSVAVDDYELGITHVLNGKDHADNAKKEAMIIKSLGGEPPVYKHWGRINFEGFTLSASKTKISIEEGEYNGWDDIRLPFLPALRRRGYQPGAIRRFALEIGLSLNDKSVSQDEFWKSINSFNRDIIDPSSKRFFIITNPKKIRIINAPEMKIELDLHPDHQKGGRKLKAGSEFIIEKEDYDNFKDNEMIRLMDCLNFRKNKDGLEFYSTDYNDFRKNGKQIIHWLPAREELVDVDILMPDNTTIKAVAEPGVKKLRQGEIIQAERFGFLRLDKKTKDRLFFWYTHG